ncbi:recombination regulator RecX [Brooklawnia cerclae]|uniref:Regulatory protein RecX n=1 Tax=Brooklawnia cerclae TaxID=349934 RepID=A0ABX0SJV1_9ACTN|nr:regulatory protein [Brooklawnia cerclae]
MDEPSSPSPDRQADPYAVAREIALRALDRRAYAREELGAYLLRRGTDEQTVKQVLNRLGEVGLLDDEAFAAQWVESRHAGRLLSRRALRRELLRKGLPDEIISDAVAQVDDDGEASAALELARRKARALHGVPEDVVRRRILGALGRRGFGSEVSLAALRQVLGESEDSYPF